MLLQFSVTNHRSIKDTAIISMKASTDKSLSDCLISSDGKNSLCLFLLCMAQMQPERAMFSMHSCSCVMVCGQYAKLLKGETLPGAVCLN